MPAIYERASLSNPANWPAPNYINPAIVGHYLTPVLCMFLGLTTLVLALRLYARAWVLRSFGLDDWIILPAYLMAVGCTIGNILSESMGGFGKHVYDLRPQEFVIARQLSFSTQLTFTMSIALTKISILFFYFRFSQTKSFRWSIYAVMGFMLAWVTAFMFLIIFQCKPPSDYWGNNLHPNCIPYATALHTTHGVLNVFSDFLVLLLPIMTIVNLQLPRRQKISLIVLFGLGLIVCIAGILRTIAIFNAGKTSDLTWYGYNLWLYTSLEAQLGILCASVPSIKPLIVQAFPRFGSSKDGMSLTGDSKAGKFHPISARPKAYPMTSIISSHGKSSNDSDEMIIPHDKFAQSPPAVPHKGSGVMKTFEVEVHSDAR